MAGQWGNVSRKRLMQNITVLWSIKDIVERPKENDLLEVEADLGQLSIEREKQLVDHLAFLAGTEEDCRNVKAVCVEESRDHSSLTIRLASNKGDNILTLNGFREIAKILEEASSRGRRIARCYTTILRLTLCIQ
jgi:hypothetical protein